MKSLNVYLTFDGNCEEALNFYKYCLGGEIVSMQRFGEGPMEVDESAKDRVMHAAFKAQEIFFMASDTMPGGSFLKGSQISLSINFTEPHEQDRVFRALSEDGKVTMPLEDTFWGARFGMVTDKYGIQWMLNLEKE